MYKQRNIGNRGGTSLTSISLCSFSVKSVRRASLSAIIWCNLSIWECRASFSTTSSLFVLDSISMIRSWSRWGRSVSFYSLNSGAAKKKRGRNRLQPYSFNECLLFNSQCFSNFLRNKGNIMVKFSRCFFLRERERDISFRPALLEIDVFPSFSAPTWL